MKTRRLERGTLGWGGLVSYIITYDIYALKTGRETLSGAFYRSVAHPWKRWPVTLIWGTVTAHLFHLIPNAWDPIHRLGRFFSAQD